MRGAALETFYKPRDGPAPTLENAASLLAQTVKRRRRERHEVTIVFAQEVLEKSLPEKGPTSWNKFCNIVQQTKPICIAVCVYLYGVLPILCLPRLRRGLPVQRFRLSAVRCSVRCSGRCPRLPFNIRFLFLGCEMFCEVFWEVSPLTL